jgi:starvation-inducible DNA-binding protein
MYRTKNDLPAEVREKIATLLNTHLSQGIDLMLQGKQAHWNVKGPQFIALHELFDKIVEDSEGWVDDLAERAVALGGVAEGTIAAVSGRSKLPAYPLNLTTGPQHIEALATSLAAFGASVRAAIDESGKLGDADTADLYTGISREVDKFLWFLEAHLQGG